MSAKILKFPDKTSTWDKLTSHFDQDPNKKGYYSGLLRYYKKQEQEMDDNVLLQDWLEVRNRIRSIEKKLKEV